MAKIGTNKTIGQPKSGTMRVANATSSGFGIIYADEIIGHRRVDTFAELANIPNWALYDQAGGANISTAKGQLWYVSGDSKLYQLTGIGADGGNRVWTEFKGTDSSYSLPVMTDTVLGGAKLKYNTTQTVAANTVSTTVNRTYAVQKNSDDQLVVNVPWHDNNDNTTYTFKNGTDGSFTVTPSGGTAQTVKIGTPANATHASTADSATNATNALNATNATNATNADKATKDGDGNVIKNTYATKSEISALTSALVYKNTVNKASDLPTTNVKVGDVYVVATEGMYAGQICENGDMIIAKVGGNTPEWTIVQTNIDGAITIKPNEKLTKDCIVIGASDESYTSVIGLAPSAGYLYWNGTKYVWKTPAEFNLKPASSTALGGIKIGFAQTGKKYPVQLGTGTDADKAFVEVPWTDTKYSLPIAKNSILGGIRTDYTTSASNKNYAVKTDTDGKAYVNVPWTDTNTTYTAGNGIEISDSNAIALNDTVAGNLRDAFEYGFNGYIMNISTKNLGNGITSLYFTPGAGNNEEPEIIKIYDSADTPVEGLASIAAVRDARSQTMTEIAKSYATISSVSTISNDLNNKVNTADKITEADINALFINK